MSGRTAEPGEGPEVGSDLVPSQLMMGSNLGSCTPVLSGSPPARIRSGRVQVDGISPTRLALLPTSVRCVPYYMSFSGQIVCSGRRWLMSLVGAPALW